MLAFDTGSILSVPKACILYPRAFPDICVMKLMLTKKARWMWIMNGKSFRVSSMLRSVQRSLLAKRIADAFVSGHEYYDFYEEGLFVKKALVSIDSETANAMLTSTVLGKGIE